MAAVGSLKKGDKVKCSAERDWNGTHLASFVRKNTYTVIQVGGSNLSNKRIVIGINGKVTAAVDIKYLTKIGKTKNTNTKAKEGKIQDIKTSKKHEINVDVITNKVYTGSSSSGTTQYINTGAGIKVVGKDPLPSEVEYHFPEETNFAGAVTSDAMTEAQKLWIRAIEHNEPSIVQNAYNFPKKKSVENDNTVKNALFYKYSYEREYDSDKLNPGDSTTVNADFGNIIRDSNIMYRRVYDANNNPLVKNTKYYNRFKLDNPDDQLTRSFAHVFFVKPDCRVFKKGHGLDSKDVQMESWLETNPEFYYAKKHSPELLGQLTQHYSGQSHNFMLYLSNKARSFELSDEYIVSDTYGQAMTGYKVPYGKDNVESKTAQKFSINYVDNRDLHTYQLHKMWIDYIAMVFRGKAYPFKDYIKNKIIDYATCVYYIVCSEDGESIIFWSKYWGVFPLEAPSSGFSYSLDNPGGVKMPELKIEYQYAWKEDYNPLSLVEFNMHTSSYYRATNKYVGALQKSGDEYLPMAAHTWAGVPFIETVNNDKTPYTFKLRFRPGDANSKK